MKLETPHVVTYKCTLNTGPKISSDATRCACRTHVRNLD